MAELNRLEHEVLVNFDAATLTGVYQIINGSGTAEPLIAFKVYNSSENLIILSYDGTNDHDFVPPGGTFIFDSQANADGFEGIRGYKKLPQGQKVWAKTSSNTNRLLFVGYR